MGNNLSVSLRLTAPLKGQPFFFRCGGIKKGLPEAALFL